ncbi:MAG: glycosyltransferase [Acidobacteriota bacterium]
MDPHQQRLRFVRSLVPAGKTILELSWDDAAGVSLNRGHDAVLVSDAWDLDRDPHPVVDAAVRHLNRDGVLVLAVSHRPYANRWQEPEPEPSLSALHLQTVLQAQFDDVQLWHQSTDSAFTVVPGAPDDASFYVAVARAPRVAARKVDASIVIPVFNKCELTRNCLLALQRHTPPQGISFEVIVVDNASWDRTSELLHLFSQRPGFELRVVRNDSNLGFAKASNQGALIARGDVVVFLNNDTEVHAGWLAPLVDELKHNASTGCAGARLLFPDGSIQHAGVAIGRNSIPYHIHLGKPAGDPLVMERRAFPVVTGACLAVRRTQFLRLGLFDEAYVNGTEDIDLCLRYADAGLRCIYRPDSVTTHHEGQTEGRLNHRDKNVERLFDRRRTQLIQDDFLYQTREADRERPERALRFAVKIGVPNRQVQNWGDTFFAEALAKSIAQQGHHCVIHYLNEWGRDDRDIDVVIHLKGLSRYVPKPWNVNLMWMINHPSMHTDEELAGYDGLLVASKAHAATLRQRLTVPIYEFLQATDAQQFRPYPELGKCWDLVFVGNNGGRDRDTMRKVVADLLPTRYKLGVWGGNWQGLLPEGVWQGKFVPNHQLPQLYSSAWIVLNDHQREMRDYGFVNNRTFDAAACGSIVVSDDVAGLDATLPVHRYRTPGELRVLVESLLNNRVRETERAGALRDRVLTDFTFDARVRELVRIATPLLAKKQAFPVVVRDEAPLVSTIMATKDRREFLPDALRTMRAQSYSRWELILVNDGGASVADIVAAQDDQRIRLLELPSNHGKGHALNVAARAAAGPFLAHQDDDDIWRPDHLERLMLPLQQIPSVQFAYATALDVHLEKQLDGSWRQQRRHLVYDRHTTPPDLFFYNQIQGITVAHRRSLFFEAGGYDERLKVLIDWDLWRRIAALTPPYYVSRVTAERTLRSDATQEGHAHLTRLIDRDPIAYYLNRLRILRKPLAFPGDPSQQVTLSKLRTDGRWELMVMIGEQRLKRGELDKACATFLRATNLRPDRAGGWRGLGFCLLKLGHAPQALQAYAQTARIGPTQPTDYLYGALAALASNEPEAALMLLDALEQAHDDLAEMQRQMAADYRVKAQALRATRERTVVSA